MTYVLDNQLSTPLNVRGRINAVPRDSRHLAETFHTSEQAIGFFQCRVERVGTTHALGAIFVPYSNGHSICYYGIQWYLCQ
jgi:hypothetical protein